MNQKSKENTPLRRYSRVTKFGYVVIFLLALLWLISTILITVMTIIAELKGATSEVTTLIETVSGFIKIDVAGAIGTIATAVIARYGIREFSANWKGVKYDSETEKDEQLDPE